MEADSGYIINVEPRKNKENTKKNKDDSLMKCRYFTYYLIKSFYIFISLLSIILGFVYLKDDCGHKISPFLLTTGFVTLIYTLAVMYLASNWCYANERIYARIQLLTIIICVPYSIYMLIVLISNNDYKVCTISLYNFSLSISVIQILMYCIEILDEIKLYLWAWDINCYACTQWTIDCQDD